MQLHEFSTFVHSNAHQAWGLPLHQPYENAVHKKDSLFKVSCRMWSFVTAPLNLSSS